MAGSSREVYRRFVAEVAINVTQSEIDSIRRKQVVRSGFRAYRDGRIGVSGSIGSFDEDEQWNRAEEALTSRGVEYPFELSGDNRLSIDSRTAPLLEADFPAAMESLLEDLRRDHPGLVFSNKIGLLETRRSLTNPDSGLYLDHRSDRIDVDIIFREEGSTAIFDGFLIPDRLDKYDPSMAAEEYGSLCRAFANRVPLPAERRLPVVFSRETVSTATRKFSTDLNGVSFASGASLLSGRTGEKIFSKDFTLFQCHDPGRGCGCFFDAEGVVNDGFLYPLIEDGVLRAACTDKRTAAMFGLPLTGSAGGAYDGVPRLVPAALRVGRSTRTLSQLLDGQPGILVMLAEGGEYKPDGALATPVQTAMLHDGTNPIGRLPELRVSSSIFSMFGEEGFRGVSSDSITGLADNPCLVVDMDVEKA